MTTFNFLLRNLNPKFPLGQIGMTANAMRNLEPEDIHASLSRHAGCDWGDVGPEDHKANESALWGGGRLFSVFHGRNAVKFWIITEADRSATTILMPDDY
jgi:hypothetical protein